MTIEESILDIEDFVLTKGPGAFAKKLESLGIKGDIESTKNCPVAHYLEFLHPGYGFEVGVDFVMSWPVGQLSKWVIQDTYHMGVFVDEFDKGYYPNLVKMES